FETLVRQMGLGRIRSTDVVRGPTTSQFWTVARKVPGLSHHFGLCHACQAPASADDEGCRACGVSFRVSLDRDRMGLGADGAQTSAFGDTAKVRSMPQQSVSPSEDAAAESPVPTEELNSRTSTQLRRELLAARRRQNALHWLVGALVLGVLGLLVLQELKSPGTAQLEPSAPSAPSAPTPAPSPSQSIPTAPSASGSTQPVAPIEAPDTISQKPPLAPNQSSSPPQDDQLSLDDALRLYQRAIDTSRSPEARQAELGGLEVELVSLVASASPERKAQWQTLENLVRQAITDLQAELRLAPEVSKATFRNSPEVGLHLLR
ncbi:MAG: hypothetical protein VXW42_01250, partial [Planctomycetota bacterium]|nr:hypothetical protein [Planctomycetota bacterium]